MLADKYLIKMNISNIKYCLHKYLMILWLLSLLIGYMNIGQLYATAQVSEIEKNRELTMENVKISGIVSNLGVNYMIETESLRQYPDLGFSELERPQILQVNADGHHRKINANFGIFYENQNLLHLRGNVTIVDQRGSETETRMIGTEQFEIRLDEPVN